MDSTGVLVTAGLTALSASISYNINTHIPKPYMDEIFHIPQAQKYCQGDFFLWDDKITTLPGLYFVTIGILNPLSKWSNQWLCTTSNLRMINLGFLILTFIVLSRLMQQIHGGKHYYDSKKAALSALTLATFPLLYFFTFLYYTDVGSTFMVLLMYCLHLDKRDWFASFIGALAVLFRQTNIVWVFFVAVQCAMPHIIASAHDARMIQSEAPIRFSLTTIGQLQELLEGSYLLLFTPKKVSQLIFLVLKDCFGYLIVAFTFVAFVIYNQGVVVGDRSAHQVVMHPTQILYFSAFCLAWGAPYALARLEPFFETIKRHWIASGIVLMIMIGTVQSYTMAHPYLLADNRHYTFYLWRKIIQKWTLALVPMYFFASFCLLYSLRRTDLAFKVAYPICLILNVMPQYLLEFRYFVIPFMFYRLQVRPQSWLKLLAELIIFTIVNIVTLYLFIYVPFTWPQNPGEHQRFMW